MARHMGRAMITRRTALIGMGAGLACAKGARAMACYRLNPEWEFVADGVMGGVSQGEITPGDRASTRLRGDVRLENNGGFIQMAFNLRDAGGVFDASLYQGLAFETRGNGERYEVGLRTSDLRRPWQSFRASFVAGPDWTRVMLSFETFTPNLTDIAFDPAKLRRIGILAVGRAFAADVSVTKLCLVPKS